ncbi:MAG TPA: hypothetical protein VLE53_14415 [Gemmatimonadaceae bacterium]|nr:hypothetical protein [Gemmatimonadaceae bacterium]
MAVTELTEHPAVEPSSMPVRRTPRPSTPPARTGGWSAAQRFGFRFAFAYFVLYLFPFPLNAIPLLTNLIGWWGGVEAWLARWTETRLFGLAEPVPIVPTGSGDTMQGWALQALWLLIAVIVTVVWTVMDRRRREYRRLHQWLRVYVRFGLATIMLSYGFAKIIPNQMPGPFLDRLVQPFGEFSPMGVLWTFMSVSDVYQVFTGIGEALGGLLLVFRRTVTLGALLLVAVLSNVVLMNFTFDVPVKLYSSNLLLMALLLALPDVRRLLNVLVLNRTATARTLTPLFAARWTNAAAAVLGIVFIAYVMWGNIQGGLSRYRESTGPNAPKLPVFGIWDVEELTRNAVLQPPLLSDSTRLRRVVFGEFNRATFRLMSDSVERYGTRVDSTKQEITLLSRFGPTAPSGGRILRYARPDSAHLVLTEVVNGDSVVIRLRRVDERRFLLLSRGFHWIQEQPFNR